MDEFGLIRRYFARAGRDDGVRVGIGDDGAVLVPTAGSELVAATDTLVEGVHFPESLDSFHVGWRTVMANLSDFAAMAATPRWMTLALSVPEVNSSWLDGFAAGVFAAADRYGVSLVGGDTTRGRNIVISLQVIGEVPAGQALLRSGAAAGDTIFVTGTPGDAAAGLDEFDADDRDDALQDRFMRPVARVEYGLALRTVATAAIDVSDGLYGDLGKLLAASGCGGRIELDRLPISEALRTRYPRAKQIRFALAGGDDYELCFTAPAGTVPAASAHRVTPIGRVVKGKGVACYESGEPYRFTDDGFLHFA